MEFERLELGSFESAETCAGARKRDRLLYGIRRRRFPEKPPFRKKPERDVRAYSMLAKLGICAAAGALVLVGNAYTTINVNAPLSSTEEEDGTGLGKLRFVELPGLLEVFSPGGKYVLPADCSALSLLEEGTVLCLNSSLDQAVEAPDAGKVKTVGLDADYGSYVSIVTGDDREIQVYGLSSISVEEGQSVLAGDTLGYTETGEEIYVKLLQAGRLMEIDDYFNVKGLS